MTSLTRGARFTATVDKAARGAAAGDGLPARRPPQGRCVATYGAVWISGLVAAEVIGLAPQGNERER